MTESGDKRRGAVDETTGMWDTCLKRPPAGRVLADTVDKMNYFMVHTSLVEHHQPHDQ